MLDERRNYIRKSLSSTVSVFDRNTNEYIGLVADWSKDGLLITSSVNPIKVGSVFEYMLLAQSPNHSEVANRATIEAKSVWCEQSSPSFYGTGFRITALSDDAERLLESSCH